MNSSNQIKVRVCTNNDNSFSWINAFMLEDLKLIKTEELYSKVYFEFQNIKTGEISKSHEYVLWSYEKVYDQYINKINLRLNTINGGV